MKRLLGAHRTTGRNGEPHSKPQRQEVCRKSCHPSQSLPPPAPQLHHQAGDGSAGPFCSGEWPQISRPGQVHLTGRACVTCHDLAAREAGKGAVGILSSYSGKGPLQPPRLRGRAFRNWMAKDTVKLFCVHSRGAFKAKGTDLSKAQKACACLGSEQ